MPGPSLDHLLLFFFVLVFLLHLLLLQANELYTCLQCDTLPLFNTRTMGISFFIEQERGGRAHSKSDNVPFYSL
jgi:hypothetical protein